MAKKAKSSPTLTVKHIGVFSFSIRHNNYNRKNPNVRFAVNNNLRFSVSDNIINLILLVTYHHPESEPFLLMEIENIFELTELGTFINQRTNDITPAEMNIPENVLINIASISFSHARAVVGQHTAGTPIQHIYLPIIDGRDFARNIFGEEKVK